MHQHSSTVELRSATGREGFEPSSAVLETAILPLNYRPMCAVSLLRLSFPGLFSVTMVRQSPEWFQQGFCHSPWGFPAHNPHSKALPCLMRGRGHAPRMAYRHFSALSYVSHTIPTFLFGHRALCRVSRTDAPININESSDFSCPERCIRSPCHRTQAPFISAFVLACFSADGATRPPLLNNVKTENPAIFGKGLHLHLVNLITRFPCFPT